MLLELLILSFLFIVIKDLQIIKNELSGLSITNPSIKKQSFNPNDMFAMLNQSLKSLNDELSNDIILQKRLHQKKINEEVD